MACIILVHVLRWECICQDILQHIVDLLDIRFISWRLKILQNLQTLNLYPRMRDLLIKVRVLNGAVPINILAMNVPQKINDLPNTQLKILRIRHLNQSRQK